MEVTYQDFAAEISNDLGMWMGTVESVLRWLDSHRDRTPGRKLTEAQWNALVFDEYVSPKCIPRVEKIRSLAERIGTSITPNPEPTEAQLLAEAISALDDAHYSDLLENDIEIIAERLTQQGWTLANNA